VKEMLYDGYGSNEWLFTILYSLNFPYLDNFWKMASYAYSYWAVGFVVLAVCGHYLRIRHTAPEQKIDDLAVILFTIITAFSVVWCCVYTFQNVTLLPRPWMVLPDLVAPTSPLLGHEGLPASAPAISSMLACLFWRYANTWSKRLLLVYVVLGCLLSIISGVNWPSEVAAGAALGFLGAGLGQRYLRFGRKLAAP